MRAQGFDVLTSQDAGRREESDARELEFATAGGRVMLTQDKDFLRLHRQTQRHQGIVFLRQRRGGIGEMLAVVVRFAQLSPAEAEGRVEFG